MQRATLNRLIKKFADIALAHGQIKSFQYDELADIKTSNALPLMYVFVKDGAVQNGVVMQIPFTIVVMDAVQKDLSNKYEVSSDCLQMCKDVVAQLRQENDLFILDENGITYSDFYDRFDFEVTGWAANVTLKIVNDFDSCDVPSPAIVDELTDILITENNELIVYE